MPKNHMGLSAHSILNMCRRLSVRVPSPLCEGLIRFSQKGLLDVSLMPERLDILREDRYLLIHWFLNS